MKRIVGRVSAGRSVLAQPFGNERGKEVVKIMRTGPRGVSEQFRDSTEYKGNQALAWARTKPFGNRPAPRKTMVGRGVYRASWLGRAGSIERITDKSVEIGVDRGLNPQVAIHQSSRSSTTIRPKARTANGDFKMRFALGLKFGVWISKKRLALGLKVARRRVSVSSAVRKEVGKLLRKAAGKAFKAPRLSTAKVAR